MTCAAALSSDAHALVHYLKQLSEALQYWGTQEGRVIIRVFLLYRSPYFGFLVLIYDELRELLRFDQALL